MLRWLLGDPYPVTRAGIVNLKNGTSFRGVIWQRKAGYLVLRNVKMLRPRGESIPVDGEVLVAESDVEFVQLPQVV